MYSMRENCVFIWKLFNNRTADEYDMVHVRVQFDRLFESTTKSKAESKAECGGYFTVVVLEALRGNPALDHDNNIHEYDISRISTHVR